MRPRHELVANQERALAALAGARDELLRIPGVVKVGVGMKETAGSITSETVIRVYVEEKRGEDALVSDEVVPKEIDGVKTDVVQFRPEVPEEDTTRYRPTTGGAKIKTDGANLYGTLCCFAHLVSDNSVVILGNHHVLYDAGVKDGADVGQPEVSGSWCCTCGEIAVNVHGILTNDLDCGIARLKSGVGHTDRVHEIGAITGVADAVAGEPVKKRGARTGVTSGFVTNLTFDATHANILSVEVKTDNGNTRFTRPGDSGSALMNETDEIIGLHTWGNNGDNVPAGNFHSTSIGIKHVLDGLKTAGFEIAIITGAPGGEGAVAELDLDELRRASDPLLLVEARLKASEEGRALLQLVAAHQHEVLGLVDAERRVTVPWRRNHGPEFVAAMARSVREPGYRIPAEIEGVTRADALRAVSDALARHGSAGLRETIAVHAPEGIEVAAACETVEELVAAVPLLDSLRLLETATVGGVAGDA